MTRSPRRSPEARLLAGLSALSLDPGLAAPLLRYVAELHKWNKAYSLTAVRDPAEMVTRHVLDSLSVLPHVRGSTLLDAGSGAGLPGIPLAIARPDLKVTLLDSSGKKARFLRNAKRALAPGNVEVVEERAERYVPEVPHDAVISRAYGPLAGFLRDTEHLAGPAGRWLAMKGKLDPAELATIPPSMRIESTPALTVPDLAEERHLVIVNRA